MKSLRVDRIIPGVGRISRAIGSDDDVRLDLCNRAITKLAKKGQIDVLSKFKAGRLDPEILFLAAFSGSDPDLAPELPAKEETLLYAVLRADTREVKLGITQDLSKRLRMIQNGNAAPLQLLGTLLGSVADERALHQRFADDRLTGEWFRYTDELAQYLSRSFSVSEINPHDPAHCSETPDLKSA